MFAGIIKESASIAESFNQIKDVSNPGKRNKELGAGVADAKSVGKTPAAPKLKQSTKKPFNAE